MQRALAVIRRAAVEPDAVVDRATLDHAARQRRRGVIESDAGLSFLVDLEKATAIHDGDALSLEGGKLLLIKAAPEPLIEITAKSPRHLMQVAWHIGNRHTPAEITEHAIFITEDHVLAEMVVGLGCTVRPVQRPFQPEAGAYAGHGNHHHDES